MLAKIGPPLDAVVFDMDGVLVDTLGALYGVYASFLADFSCQGTPEEFETLNGPSLQELVTILQQTHGLPGDTVDLVEAYHAKMTAIYDVCDLMPGVQAVLVQLQQAGVLIGVASSASREAIQKVVSRFGLAPYLQAVVSGDDVTHAKPDPEIYRRAFAALGVEAAWVVEDAQHGLVAAKSAGAHTVFFNPHASEALVSVDSTVASMAALGELFRQAKAL